jgi:hypothetical protein
MSYNWDEIFKHKSNRELYNIYLGKCHLPKDVGLIAKKVLEQRGFDFNNIGKYSIGWKLSDLTKEEYDINHNVNWNTTFHISLKLYIITSVIYLFILNILLETMDLEIKNKVLISSLVFISITLHTIINNQFHKRNLRKRGERKNEILRLRQILIEENNFNDKEVILEEIEKDVLTHEKYNKKIIFFMVISSILFFLILILTKVFKN